MPIAQFTTELPGELVLLACTVGPRRGVWREPHPWSGLHVPVRSSTPRRVAGRGPGRAAKRGSGLIRYRAVLFFGSKLATQPRRRRGAYPWPLPGRGIRGAGTRRTSLSSVSEQLRNTRNHGLGITRNGAGRERRDARSRCRGGDWRAPRRRALAWQGHWPCCCPIRTHAACGL